MALKYSYRAFGRSLESDLALPDLPKQRTPQQVDWTLRVGSGARTPRVRLAAEQLIDGEFLRVWKTDVGCTFVYEPVGEFEIAGQGRQITWFPAPSPAIEIVRSAVLGPVLALALHEQGTPCLHGSGVRIGRSGVAFVAPKRYGKSTLTSALVEAGAQLITDDTLAVQLGGTPMMLPGVHSVKLWRDSFAKVAPKLPKDTGSGVKPTLRGFPARVRRSRATPLAAIYQLWPVSRDAGGTVQRHRLPLRDAALSLVSNSKIAQLLEPASSGLLLGAATEIAARVPVYLLRVPRDWDRLAEVVTTLMGWHGAQLLEAVGE